MCISYIFSSTSTNSRNVSSSETKLLGSAGNSEASQLIAGGKSNSDNLSNSLSKQTQSHVSSTSSVAGTLLRSVVSKGISKLLRSVHAKSASTGKIKDRARTVEFTGLSGLGCWDNGNGRPDFCLRLLSLRVFFESGMPRANRPGGDFSGTRDKWAVACAVAESDHPILRDVVGSENRRTGAIALFGPRSKSPHSPPSPSRPCSSGPCSRWCRGW